MQELKGQRGGGGLFSKRAYFRDNTVHVWSLMERKKPEIFKWLHLSLESWIFSCTSICNWKYSFLSIDELTCACASSLILPDSAGQTNCTGFTDGDYPCLDTSLPALADLPSLNPDVHHVPLPPELIEEFQSILACDLMYTSVVNYYCMHILARILSFLSIHLNIH